MSGSGTTHDLAALAQSGKNVNSLADGAHFASEIDNSRVPDDAWGLLGQVYFHGKYDELLGQLIEHSTSMTTAMQGAGDKITSTAQDSSDNEKIIAKQFKDIHGKLSATAAPPAVGSGDKASSTDGSGIFFVSGTTMAKSAPLAGGPYKSISKLITDAKGDPSQAEITNDISGVISEGANVAGEAVSFCSDPLGWLISKGLGFLINILKPLKDALQMVTGDGPAVLKAAGNFNKVGKDIEQLGQQFEHIVNTGFASSSGAATDAARSPLNDFRHGIAGTAGNAGDIASLLQLSSMIMQAAEDFIKGIITDVVEFIIVSQAAGVVGSFFSFGASEAIATAADAAKVAEEALKAEKKISEVSGILNKITAIWNKIGRKLLTESKGKVWKTLDKMQSGKHAKPNFTTGLTKTFTDSVKDRGAAAIGIQKRDPKTAIDNARNSTGVASKLGGGGVVGEYGDRGEDRTDQQIDDDLDV